MATTVSSPNGEQDTSIFGRFLVPNLDAFYVIFRLLFAFVVSLHGAQKAFLLWGFPAAHPLGARVDIAGWVEIIAALLIGFGVFTRLGAGALVVVMIVAYFTVHSGGVAPHIFPNPPGDMGSAFGAHGGEVPILWFPIAAIIGVMGSRKYGLERLILKKEIL